jgi:hypothetical protein
MIVLEMSSWNETCGIGWDGKKSLDDVDEHLPRFTNSPKVGGN